MAGADEAQAIEVGLDDRVDERRHVIGRQRAVIEVQALDDRGRPVALQGVGARHAAQLAHPRRRAHPAPGDVADDEAQAAAGQRDRVVPVAPHVGPVAARVEVGGERHAGHARQLAWHQVALEGGGDVVLALEEPGALQHQRGALAGVRQQAAQLRLGHRAGHAADRHPPQDAAGGEQRDGDRVAVGRRGGRALADRLVERRAGRGAVAVDGLGGGCTVGGQHPHGGSRCAEHLGQAPAQLTHQVGEAQGLEPVGDRGDLGEALGERLRLAARRALGHEALAGALGLHAVAQVPELQEQMVAAGLAALDGRDERRHRHAHPVARQLDLGRERRAAQRPQARSGLGELAAAQDVVEAPADEPLGRLAQQRPQRRIGALDHAGRIRQGDAVGRSLEGVLQQGLGACPRATLALELREHGDLRAQHRRIERLEDVVHAAGLVPAQDVLDVLAAVHPRHLHVEQDNGEVVEEQLAQRLLARARGDQVDAERREHGLERQEILLAVVDEQDLGGREVRRGGFWVV